MSELIDNRAHRIQTLKDIIQHLHAGVTIHGHGTATHGRRHAVEEVRSMCDLQSQVTRDVLAQLTPTAPVLPGHPIDTAVKKTPLLKR